MPYIRIPLFYVDEKVDQGGLWVFCGNRSGRESYLFCQWCDVTLQAMYIQHYLGTSGKRTALWTRCSGLEMLFCNVVVQRGTGMTECTTPGKRCTFAVVMTEVREVSNDLPRSTC